MNKRLIILTVLTLTGLLLIISWTQTYLFKGRLEVTTSDKSAVITVTSDAGGQPKKIGNGHASTHLSAGRYLVSASAGDSISESTVAVNNHATTKTDLTIQPVKQTSVAIPNIAAASLNSFPGGLLIYVNNAFRVMNLSSTFSQKTDVYQPNIYPVNDLAWLDDGSAVVASSSMTTQFLDTAGATHDIGINLVTQANGFGVSTGGAIAYLDRAKLMYRSSPLANDTKQVAELDGSPYAVLPSPDGRYVFAFHQASGSDSSNDKSTPGDYLVDASASSKKALKLSSPATSALWNPDSRRLIYASGSHFYVYSLTGDKSETILTGASNTPVWLMGFTDSQHFIFGQNEALWSVDISDPQFHATKLANYAGSLTPTSFDIAPDNAGFFYSTDADTQGKGGNIYLLKL